ncbi:transcription termination factor Rho [Patescibacteria group bacterium]|nr:transcription termination factor Rho [Patescibacteria group bacterium]
MSTQLNAADAVGQTPENKVVEEKVIKEIPVEPVRPRRNFVGRSRSNYSRQSNNSSNEDRDYNDSHANGNGAKSDQEASAVVTGFLDTTLDGHGVLRVNFSPSEGDAYISTSQIRRLKLRPGDVISGPARAPKENERYWGLLKVDTVNGESPEKMIDRVRFQTLTPVYPNEQIKMETGEEPLSTRVIDMIAPIGKGQRSLIVSPPKAGKTTLLMQLATGIAANYPDIHLMAVLVGERPEEVTDFRRHIERITKGKGEVAASNFDESAEDQCRVAEIALERAKRLVEQGKDVVILLDSITRLARAYNLSIPTSGRTLSGGFDPAALFPPKKFFGAARNFEVGGSLTIIATCLVDTGSRMDDLVYEEFKGTGNQEVHLDRRLAERRIYPAIDVQRSGTRRDDLLIDPMTYQSVLTLQRMLDLVDKEQRTQTIIDRMRRTSTNKEFLASLKEG